MSRGVKDLRELVVVSRLSYRNSDSDSDDGRAGMITPFESVDDKIPVNYSKTPRSSPTPPSSADSGIGKRKKKRKRRPKGYVSESNQSDRTRPVHQFSKFKPLPAVGTPSLKTNGNASQSGSASSCSNDSLSSQSLEEVSVANLRLDYSDLVVYLEESVVAEWLARANKNLKELTLWCTDANFVKFAQFWITEFGVERRHEILSLEHSILLDELTLAFRRGLEEKKLQHKDIVEFLSAIFREYPGKLTMAAGVYLFLDYLDIFTSERTVEYRQILSDVKLSTTNKEHVQLILASRCFMLINVWVAIIDFYRQISSASPPMSDYEPTGQDKLETYYCRLSLAINLGLVEVVHYLLFSGKCSAGFVDSQKKTILLTAVAANQSRVVEYLLKKWTGCVDVNRPCDTGNAPLHVAINVGNPKIIQLLVNMPDIDVNRVNPECDDATPLHLAALHGNAEIVRILLKKKADTKLLMAGQTVAQIAQDFGHSDILSMLEDNES